MREIHVSEITRAVRDMAMRSCVVLGEDVMAAFRAALEREESPQGKEVLRRILENAEIARADNIPTCQDTGLAVMFVEVGQEVHIAGGSLREAINEGVKRFAALAMS